MLFPLRDLNPTRRRPVVTRAIVWWNLGLFLVVQVLWFGITESSLRFGAVAAQWTQGARWIEDAPPVLQRFYGDLPAVGRAFTHMWMHGDLLHLIGNCWMLWVFGDNVEDWFGRRRFVVAYLAWGLVALSAQVLFDPDTVFPMIGASGAIAGCLGAYLRLYPRAQVVVLAILGFLPLTLIWSAGAFLALWFALQLLSIALGGGGGVAWSAHAGGFAAGWLTAHWMLRGRLKVRARTPLSVRFAERR